jgi:parallel beta-helix repeat protein
MPEPIAFLSYTRFDDTHEEERIAKFCERLSGEVRMQTGQPFPIFRDKKDIQWGQRWRERIEEGLDAAVFLIPILTPSYFQSDICRDEYELFLEREKKLGRDDLILAVYYVECDELEDTAIRESNSWVKDLSERRYEDWRSLRWEPWTSATIGRAFEQLAKQIKQALKVASPKTVSRPVREPTAMEGALAQAAREIVAGRVRRKEPPTHIVDAMGRGNFLTISEAIKATQPGDRILVCPGYYPEGLVLDKPLEIIGDGDCSDIIVEAKGKNVILFKANMGIVRNLTLRQAGGGNYYAVNIGQGRLVLEDCDITSQSLPCCIAVHGRADPQIRRNRIHDAKQGGILVYDNGLGTIEDNDIFGNAYAGVEISEGGNPTVRYNRIHDGQQTGVIVYQSGLGTIEGNDIFGNAYAGVEIREGSNPTIRRNRIHDGKSVGVGVGDNGLGAIEDNDIFGNALSGVEIRGGSDPTVRHNCIHDGKTQGVYVHENGLGTIEDNDIFGNAYAGVGVTKGGNPTVRNNRINRNGYYGVWVRDKGAGTFEDNDLRDNVRGAWDIEPGCEVKGARNRE